MNTYNLIDVYAPLMVMFSGEVSGGPSRLLAISLTTKSGQ